MSRTPLFRNIQRSLQLALAAERERVSTPEILARAEASAQRRLGRRGFLQAAGVATAAVSVGCTLEGPAGASAALTGSADVGIVGAGMAGISCATELARRGVAATIHEASDRVGGRVWSMGGAFAGPTSFPGQVIERGGELIDTTHGTMKGYARELGLTLEEYRKREGEEVFFFDGAHVPEARIVDEWRALVPQMSADLRTSSGGPTADSHTEGDRVLDYTTLAEWLETRGAGPIVKKAIEIAYTIEYGRPVDEQSCLNMLLFAHADRRSRFLPFGVFSDERYHVVEGNQAIPVGLEARLPGATRFGRFLVAVRKRADGRIELTFEEGRRLVTAVHDTVVLTVPFSVLRGVDLDPSLGLPAWKTEAIEGFRYGTNAKLMIGFRGAPWASYGSNGTSYSDLSNHQNTWETNYSAATEASALLTDYSGGERGARLDPSRPTREADRFLADLERIWPGSSARASRDSRGRLDRVHLEQWTTNPLSLGSYSCNAPGYFTTIAGNEGKSIGNLHFAGEHADSFYSWQGFMEGAALSGIAAAATILDAMGARTAV